jgi:hypothetical protein
MIKSLDTRWVREAKQPNRPFITALLRRPLSKHLQARADERPELEQVMVMDRRGLLIAATHATHDYDQSDEPKVQRTIEAGNSLPLDEGAGFDPEVKAHIAQASQAVRDPQSGALIGVVTVRVKL